MNERTARTSTRTVDNFIANLRTAFEPDPSYPKHLLNDCGNSSVQ